MTVGRCEDGLKGELRVGHGETGEPLGSTDDVESLSSDRNGGKVVAVEEVDLGENAVAEEGGWARVEAILQGERVEYQFRSDIHGR